MRTTIAIFGLTLASAPAFAQSNTSASSASSFTRISMRATFCAGRRHCDVEHLVDAGRANDGAPLAVIRVHDGPDHGAPAIECRPYHDWLSIARRGRVIAVRELFFGAEPCLEWQPTTWHFERGELIVSYSGMGAPPPASTDTRPVALHLQPWPLAVVAEYRGTDGVTPPRALTSTGPLVRLTME